MTCTISLAQNGAVVQSILRVISCCPGYRLTFSKDSEAPQTWHPKVRSLCSRRQQRGCQIYIFLCVVIVCKISGPNCSENRRVDAVSRLEIGNISAAMVGAFSVCLRQERNHTNKIAMMFEI